MTALDPSIYLYSMTGYWLAHISIDTTIDFAEVGKMHWSLVKSA